MQISKIAGDVTTPATSEEFRTIFQLDHLQRKSLWELNGLEIVSAVGLSLICWAAGRKEEGPEATDPEKSKQASAISLNTIRFQVTHRHHRS